ncbi:hypothetical protein AMECASPLE_023257 [Ameca splendens]|uniref:Uncharacterized protein n=1 Tax=Ameca splendens TaxID=208324 RepID=A0ABV0ZNW1_9TELE
MGERRGTPWTGRQSIAGQQTGQTTTHTHPFTPKEAAPKTERQNQDKFNGLDLLWRLRGWERAGEKDTKVSVALAL